MKAVLYNRKSSPERLIYTDVQTPFPGENQVLVKIYSTSINAADYRSMKSGIIPKNRIFGADISGIVESAGNNVRKFKQGDEVIGELSGCGFGGFAEYAAVPENVLALKPQNISFEDAGVLPLAATTALQALRNKGNIQKGQKVLIVGAGGGVGNFAVQLAKYYGGTVTAVCSAANIEQAKLSGADVVLDYRIDNFEDHTGMYDLILAVNGNYPLLTYRKCLKQKGIFVTIGGDLKQILKTLLFSKFLSFGSKKMLSFLAKSNHQDLELIAKLAAEGKIKPIIDRRYTLENTPEAIHYVSKGHARGKVAVKVL